MKIKVKIIPDDGPVEVYECESYSEVEGLMVQKGGRYKEFQDSVLGSSDKDDLSPVDDKPQGFFNKLFGV